MERPLFHLCEIFRDCVECSYCDVTIASLFLKKLSPNVGLKAESSCHVSHKLRDFETSKIFNLNRILGFHGRSFHRFYSPSR